MKWGFIRGLAKRSLYRLGLDAIPSRKSPKYTLLGLRSLSIRSVIDVGAHEGQFARYISNIFPNAKLYCFEPLSEPFQKLKSWADLQERGRVTLFNTAVGDTRGTAEMFCHVEHTTSSSLLETTDLSEGLYPFMKEQQIISVNVTTLEAALGNSRIALTPDILIKLDVQGYEDRVIRGGGEVIAKAKIVILEINLDYLYKEQADFKDILLMLDDYGYQYIGNLEQNYGEGGHIIYFDAVFLK